MLQYTIVRKSSAEDLERAVNDGILEGWIPLGGVAVSVHAEPAARDGKVREVRKWAQAMVRGPQIVEVPHD